ncbi:maltose excess protein 1-like, chloroplastic [Zingiber officinale]|uniref:Maltose excess protein 1-like, chloroplastic n=1 Tax=Zingiber officinale TaxID=94328 RepID=A0A8J5H953_ZINOF|nr:maltose excess protein 1-like, chloroplastic [Zingiber officinale]KAG6518685.1 hypothetical protein ZIOFF_022165 [Zingiber officinale]
MAMAITTPPALRLRQSPSHGPFRLFPPRPSRSLVARAHGSIPMPLCRRLITLNQYLPASAIPRLRSSPLSATSADDVHPVDKGSNYQEWESLTSRFAGAANIPFLLLQLPQIILNARNLLSGNNAALFAVPWLGMLTGLLGNLSLVSYFVEKKETEAVIVQSLGVVSTYVVIAQLTMAQAMPLPQFAATTVVVALGLVVNFLNYFGWVDGAIWNLWEDFITIGGLAVLPQVMWSTFVPFVPSSILPGVISFTLAAATVILARTGKLSEKATKLVGSLSGWTATLLFMWMPVAQMWTNYLNPDNIRGLSSFTMLLSMMGNGLMIPRALFIRDLMWFTGSTWASFLQGWGNLFCMYSLNTISREFFFGTTIGLLLWTGMALWRDSVAYGYNNPLRSIKELAFGS